MAARSQLLGQRWHFAPVFPHEVGPHCRDQRRHVGPAVVVPFAVPCPPASEVADQVDVLALDDRATVAPAGGRLKPPRRHRHQLALVVMALADAHPRPLSAVSL